MSVPAEKLFGNGGFIEGVQHRPEIGLNSKGKIYSGDEYFAAQHKDRKMAIITA
ncbi:MAG: hypothetical protein Q8M57_02470 [Nitrosomonas sp.]|uniref:hypothetical protein n=1 Tax=Nitrosomonas sp. TaxID=42353 RepID=UPI0027353855|nr:hypothetical protein [Nitrosomonas sp.]MDP3279909.1 hypothetical protein [Nitrosomonas sp.]